MIAAGSAVVIVWPFFAKRLVGFQELSPQEAVQVMNHRNAVVIDIRQQGQFVGGHLVNAKNFPVDVIRESIEKLTKYKNKVILLVGESSGQARKVHVFLRQQEFNEVYALEGGITAWKQANLPTKKG